MRRTVQTARHIVHHRFVGPGGVEWINRTMTLPSPLPASYRILFRYTTPPVVTATFVAASHVRAQRRVRRHPSRHRFGVCRCVLGGRRDRRVRATVERDSNRVRRERANPSALWLNRQVDRSGGVDSNHPA